MPTIFNVYENFGKPIISRICLQSSEAICMYKIEIIGVIALTFGIYNPIFILVLCDAQCATTRYQYQMDLAVISYAAYSGGR